MMAVWAIEYSGPTLRGWGNGGIPGAALEYVYGRGTGCGQGDEYGRGNGRIPASGNGSTRSQLLLYERGNGSGNGAANGTSGGLSCPMRPIGGVS